MVNERPLVVQTTVIPLLAHGGKGLPSCFSFLLSLFTGHGKRCTAQGSTEGREEEPGGTGTVLALFATLRELQLLMIHDALSCSIGYGIYPPFCRVLFSSIYSICYSSLLTLICFVLSPFSKEGSGSIELTDGHAITRFQFESFLTSVYQPEVVYIGNQKDVIFKYLTPEGAPNRQDQRNIYPGPHERRTFPSDVQVTRRRNDTQRNKC